MKGGREGKGRQKTLMNFLRTKNAAHLFKSLDSIDIIGLKK